VTCSEIAELMPLYLCGDLDGMRATAFAAHLDTCVDCAQAVKREQYYDARLRETVLSDPAGSENVTHRVRERLATGARSSIRQHHLSRSTRRFVAVTLGLAAAFAICLLGYRGLLSPQVPQVYAAAVHDHQLEVVDHQPRPWLDDPDEIAQLAQRQGISLDSISALAGQGFHLDHAKVCFLSGEAFLHLVYSNGSQQFSIYMRHQSFGQLPGLARKSTGGTGFYDCALDSGYVSSFQKANVAVVIVSNQSASGASAVSHEVYSAL
jgi:anti-sigma factor RsiW